MASTRILGIDPGFQTTGYGVIETDGHRAHAVCHGVIHVNGQEVGAKLHCIFHGIGAILGQHDPTEVAVERVFMHRNADSALKLGQARGAAITACAEKGLPVFEYTPNQVKQATVGRGHAAKQQVQHMMKILLRLAEIPPADAADALAVAVCHAHFREGLRRMPGVRGIRRGRLR